MARKKRRILALLVLICIGLSFLLRYYHEQVQLVQICPAVSDGDYRISLYWNQKSYSVLGREEKFREVLKTASLQRGNETNAMPNLCYEVRISQEGKTYILIIGADDTVSVAEVGNLEATQTFWNDPTGALFDTLYPVSTKTGTGMIPGYRPDGNYTAISFADQPYSEVNSIAIYNGHTGKTSYINDAKSVRDICGFLSNVSGTNGQSSMGYYDTLHTLTLYHNASAAAAVLAEEEPVLTITFGHDYFVYYGEYGDGYPIRYTLDEINCEDVFLFLQPFEEAHS